jgi:LysR family cys regulon transcriptional activator
MIALVPAADPMNLQQFRYLSTLADCGLNVSRAAERLHTSQPGISKQLGLLERELGIELFQRHGKQLQALTPVGQTILEQARSVLQRVESIRQSAAEALDESKGSLTIATTHTQSRYLLPPVIGRFVAHYPDVALQMQQGTPVQIAQQVARGEADLAIATEALEAYPDLVTMPCFRWNRAVLVPKGHPLAKTRKLTLEQVAQWPLVTYVHGFTGRARVDQAFELRGLQPRIVFTAADADVIKTYVRQGMGVGVIASMAVEPERDPDLVALDASHLFDWSTTSIAFRRESGLRRYTYDFISLFAPHLTRELVERFIAATPTQRGKLLTALKVPDLSL